MTKRICTIAALGTFGFAFSAAAQTASTGSARVRGADSLTSQTFLPPARTTANAAANLLQKRVESVDWVDTPFEEVIEWVKRESDERVNVIPRWAPLNIEGVDRDTLVTLQLNSATVAEVLLEALETISPDGGLAFHASGNALRISRQADFDRKMYVRVYDVTDVLFRVEDFGRDAPLIDLQQAGQRGGGGGGGGGGQSVFQGSGGGQQQGGEQSEQEFTQRVENLAEIIQEVIAPESWDTQTGGRGRIRVLDRSLIVWNTIEVHEMIAGHFVFGE